jgi:hypothetical protein
MKEVLLLSVVNAAVAFTVSEARLFKWLRDWFQERSAWVGHLVSCGYCLGMWSAFALVAIYRPILFAAWPPLDLFLTALV